MAGLADLFGGATSDFMPFLGPLADLAQGKTGAAVGAGIGTLFGPIGTFAGGILGGMLDTHGGPKIESGYSTSGFDPNTRMGEDNFTPVGSNLRRGLQNPNQDKAIVDAIQGKYNSILGQYGIKGDPLEIGAFTSFDPKGTAQTQFGLNAFLDGQNIYDRQSATGGFENVGRSSNDFMSALNSAGMGVLSGALGHYGFKVDPNTGAIDASGVQVPKPSPQQSIFGAGTALNGLGLVNNDGTSTGSNMAINATPSFGGLGSGGDLGSILGNLGSGLGNINLGQALSGLLGAQNTKQAGQSMIDFLNNQQNTMQQQTAAGHQGLMDYINGQQSKIDGLYNPGSPEANALQQQMEAKDAAAGRNSQYGVRSVDLAAKLASLKGGLDAQFAGSSIPAVNNSFNQAASNTNSFTQGTSRALADALGLRANAFPSAIGSTLGNAANGGLGTLQQLLGGQGNSGDAGALITKLFGSGGSGLDGLLNGISNNGFNATAGGNLSIPNTSQVDDIFNNPAFSGVGNTDFMNFPTNDVFGSSDFFNGGGIDISDWF